MYRVTLFDPLSRCLSYDVYCQTALLLVMSVSPLFPSGDEGARTPGLRLAKAALSQLSYIPKFQ